MNKAVSLKVGRIYTLSGLRSQTLKSTSDAFFSKFSNINLKEGFFDLHLPTLPPLHLRS